MKPSKKVIDRIFEEVLIKKLCIAKNVFTKEWAKKNLYWGSYKPVDTDPHSGVHEYYTEWYYNFRDYWGEVDEYPLTDMLCMYLCDDPYTDDEGYPPELTREQLIVKLQEMEPLDKVIFEDR